MVRDLDEKDAGVMVNHCPEQSECTDHWCERIAPGEDIPAFVRYVCHPHNLLFPPLTQADKDWARAMVREPGWG